MIERAGGSGACGDGIAAQPENHHPRRPGIGRVYFVAGKPPQDRPDRIGHAVSFNTQVVRVPRIGFGWDSHEFKPGIPLRIGGVLLPHDSGLAGHSDGDVLLHALDRRVAGGRRCAAISAVTSRPAIRSGRAQTRRYSCVRPCKQIAAKGYTVGNVDCTLVLAAPKIGPHAKAIQQNVAKLLGVASGADRDQGQDAGRHWDRQRGHRASGGAVD